MGGTSLNRKGIGSHVMAWGARIGVGSIGPISHHRVVVLELCGRAFTEASQWHTILLNHRSSMRRGIARGCFASIGCHVAQHAKFQRTIMVSKIHTRNVKVEHGRVVKDCTRPRGRIHVVCTVLIGPYDGTLEGHLRTDAGEVGTDRGLLGIARRTDTALVEHRRRHLGGLLEVVELLLWWKELLLLWGGRGFARGRGYGRRPFPGGRVEKIATHHGDESFIGSIVEIFGLLPYTILAGILQPSLNAPLAGPLITLRLSQYTTMKSPIRRKTYHRSNGHVDRHSKLYEPSFVEVERGLWHWNHWLALAFEV